MQAVTRSKMTELRRGQKRCADRSDECLQVTVPYAPNRAARPTHRQSIKANPLNPLRITGARSFYSAKTTFGTIEIP